MIMQVKRGEGKTLYGSGIAIDFTADEIATAIDAYLVAHNVIVSGPRTITINGRLIKDGLMYVDPSGSVINNDEKISGSANCLESK